MLSGHSWDQDCSEVATGCTGPCPDNTGLQCNTQKKINYITLSVAHISTLL